MDTRVERVDDTTVKLDVTVEPARVKRALDDAARHLAEEVRVPGFRKGRVPRKVLETRLGRGAVLQHALEDALPGLYQEAVQEAEIEPVGQPEFDLDTFEEGTEGRFTATVQVRPEFDPPPIDGVLVTHPEWEVTDDEVEGELDRLRERFAEAETVHRPVQVGDLAVVSVSATHLGQPVEEASADDQLYRVEDPEDSGQRIDRELLGATPGTIVKFTDTEGPGDEGRELSYTVIVKDVKELVLPDADDEFALTASEFDTIDELREGIRSQLAAQKLALARSALRGRAVETVTELVEVPIPQALVDQEVQFQLARLARDAERHEVPFDQYLAAAGTTMEQLTEQLTANARQTVRAQLVVDRIGRDAGVEVTQEDLARQITDEATRMNVPPEQVMQLIDGPERLGVLFTDAFRRKTIDLILERVEVTDGPTDEELAELLGADEDDATDADDASGDGEPVAEDADTADGAGAAASEGASDDETTEDESDPTVGAGTSSER